MILWGSMRKDVPAHWLAELQKKPKPAYLAYDSWDKLYCLIGSCLIGMSLWGLGWMLWEMVR